MNPILYPLIHMIKRFSCVPQEYKYGPYFSSSPNNKTISKPNLKIKNKMKLLVLVASASATFDYSLKAIKR